MERAHDSSDKFRMRLRQRPFYEEKTGDNDEMRTLKG